MSNFKKTGKRAKRPLHGVVQHREELKGIKRVLALVDGYLSTQDQHLALAWDGGIMTYGELREHLNAALKTKVLNDQAQRRRDAGLELQTETRTRRSLQRPG